MLIPSEQDSIFFVDHTIIYSGLFVVLPFQEENYVENLGWQNVYCKGIKWLLSYKICFLGTWCKWICSLGPDWGSDQTQWLHPRVVLLESHPQAANQNLLIDEREITCRSYARDQGKLPGGVRKEKSCPFYSFSSWTPREGYILGTGMVDLLTYSTTGSGYVKPLGF